MTDIEFSYEIDGETKMTVFPNVTIVPDYTIPRVILVFPERSNDYDSLYADMIFPAVDIAVKFDAFETEKEFESLKVTGLAYTKTVSPTNTVLYNITITLEQE